MIKKSILIVLFCNILTPYSLPSVSNHHSPPITFFPVKAEGFHYQKRIRHERVVEKYRERVPDKYEESFFKWTNYYDIPYYIAYNLIETESNWRHKVRSHFNSNGSYDIGLMQLNSSYVLYFVKRFFIGDSFEVYSYDDNMQVGLAYLRYLIDYYNGNMRNAIMAYNCGQGNVNRGTIPDNTKKYVDMIL